MAKRPLRFSPAKLARRMALEGELSAAMEGALAKFNSQQRRAYAESAVFIDTSDLRKNVNREIENHFIKIAGDDGYKRLGRVSLKQAEQEVAEIIFVAFAEARAYDSARFIQESVVKEVEGSYAAARVQLGFETALNAQANGAVAELASRNLEGRFAAQAESIAVTETTLGVERLESVKADVMAGGNLSRDPDDPDDAPSGRMEIRKRWVTVGDAFVRPSHRAAGLADAIPEDQPFIVGGERLKHPGDPSSGASLGNIIYCRCTTDYVVVELDAPPDPFDPFEGNEGEENEA